MGPGWLRKRIGSKKKHIYTIKVEDYAQAKTFLSAMGILDASGSMRFDIAPELVTKDASRTCFLRGAFLGSGSGVRPGKKGIILSLWQPTQEFANGLLGILNGYNIKAKSIVRKDAVVVYIKESDSIIKLLTLIGAHSTILSLENIRISKDIHEQHQPRGKL